MVRAATLVAGLLTVLAASLPECSAGNEAAGPGDGSWQREAPELHGLDKAALDEAAARLQANAPDRYCTVVVKDGKIVYENFSPAERYPGQPNTPDTRYEVDSAGKTMQALLMGVGVTKGLFDLDTPIATYGVSPEAAWGDDNVWWPLVTLRHILSQSTGQGNIPPGSGFTYDSDSYIDHARLLLESTAGMGSAQWAQENFGNALGLPDLYRLDGQHTGTRTTYTDRH